MTLGVFIYTGRNGVEHHMFKQSNRLPVSECEEAVEENAYTGSTKRPEMEQKDNTPRVRPTS